MIATSPVPVLTPIEQALDSIGLDPLDGVSTCPSCDHVTFGYASLTCSRDCRPSDISRALDLCVVSAASGARELIAALADRIRAQPDRQEALTSLSSHSRPATTWPDAMKEPAYQGLPGRIVAMIAPHTESDPVAILVQTLVAFGNALGRGPYFAVESTQHHANLNVVLCGVTSKGRKGTSWEHVRRLLASADADWAAQCVGSGLSSGEGLVWSVRDPISKREPIREKGRITGYQDVLVDEGVTDKRLMVVEPEFARVLRVGARDGSTLSATMREAWDSGRLRVITKNSPAVATDAHISIIGHVTRDELLRYIGATESGNGFANRFLWVCVRRSKFLPEGGGAYDAEALTRQLTVSLAFARNLGKRPIRFDEQARAIWTAVYPELSRDRSGVAGAILGRVEAQTVRLSLVYALIDQADTIRAPHLLAALALMEYAEASVAFIFGASLGDRTADEVLLALRASPAGLTRTELTKYFGNHISAARMGSVLDLLRGNGLAHVARQDTGGRPSERWFAANGMSK